VTGRARVRAFVGAAVLLGSVLAARTGSAQSPDPAALAALLKSRVEALRAGTTRIGGERLARAQEVAAFYEERRFEPVWHDRAGAAAVLDLVDAVAADGLTPEHYHRSAIARRLAMRDVAAAVEQELLGSDALAQIAHDITRGRVQTAERAITLSAVSVQRPLDALARDLRTAGAARVLARMRPQQYVYTGLVDALARLRAVEATGGWPALPAGRTLRVDSVDARIPALRSRLVLEGDLPASAEAASSTRFDRDLERAVRAFQHRHGLNEDGIVGPATLRQLNVPVERRIAQVRANLERARWIAPTLPPTFVAVNAAGAKAYMVRAGDVVLETRVIVGADVTRTPVFTAPMRYIDLNPTWTVPPGIVGEVLASVRRDAGWLRRENMQVIDDGGRVLDPNRIAFSRYSARSFPYTFRQAPGPRNPLGVIKFVFPNRYNVYLHDTPSRTLFDEEQRLFSHGCIRVQDPLDLAVRLLEDTEWTRAALDSAITTGATRTITLPTTVPVFVLYWTASTDLHGELHFYPDVYERDPALLAELDRTTP
jgi:murein L,D-transpeptidase YcbB/YkuD